MPNKAVAGTASLTFAGALTIVGLWLFDSHPPDYVVIALETVISAVITFPSIYFTPHNP